MEIPRVKTIFLSIVLLTSLFAFSLFQYSFEGEFTKTVSSSTTPTFCMRDSTHPFTSPEGSLNGTENDVLDKNNYDNGDTATIGITDYNADFDCTAVDFTSATVTMSSSTTVVTLQETGINTGNFTGTFTVVAAPSVGYCEDPFSTCSGSGDNIGGPMRASVTLPINNGGEVTISDDYTKAQLDNFLDNDFPNSQITPVNFPPLNLTLSGGASFTNNVPPTIVFNFTNSNLINLDPADCFDPGNACHLEIWYKENGVGGWAQITINCDFLQGIPQPCNFFNFGEKTITTDPNGPGFSGGEDGQGLYILAFDTGVPGGGGGGLVRPGLVVNALAGFNPGGAGGGGGGLPGPTITLGALSLNDNAAEIISMPQEIRDFINNDFDPHTPLEPITEIFEDFDLPLSINGNGFALGGYANTLVPQTVKPGEPIEFTLVFYTTSEIAHTSLNFNLGPTRLIAGSDTQVLLYKDKFEIVDPNGNIATATGSINNENDDALKRVATFSITFSDDVQWSNSDFVIRSWNDNMNSGDIIVYDAIEIAQPEIVEIADEDIPEPEIQTLKSQYVPIWIKNNAAWWSQQLIDDSDFVAGIEYLIQSEIITMQDDQVITSNSSNEIPVWIKNNAGWWSEDLITEKEFIDGLQWLISNGIIKVTET